MMQKARLQMADAEIPVDLFNPGQVFACLGLMEVANTILGSARAAFDWQDEAAPRFLLRANGEDNPVAAALAFLSDAAVSSIAPARSDHRTEKWKVPTDALEEGESFPIPEPSTPATLPALLRSKDGRSLMIDHWGESASRTRRDAVKFWAGAGGYPGAALMADALALVRDRIADAADDPFSLSAPQSSSFRFDWRRDYIPMDVGFSPNDHGNLTMVGFPLVEILAAIGLANARPYRLNKLAYRYGIIGTSDVDALFDPLFMRAALGAAPLPFDRRVFRMNLGWPGQENQARCITDVFEET
jgi:CRISPR-associated protein Csx14